MTPLLPEAPPLDRETVAHTSPACLTDPLANKGTAYSQVERIAAHIDGLLPPRTETLGEQVARVLSNLDAAKTPLDKYRYLSAVQADNETLFYRVLSEHLKDLLPIVYTPTVGEACLEWSRIFQRTRGVYLSAWQHRGRVADVLGRWPHRDVRVVVVTDGGRILGLGDLGVNGMGIPIGKLALYTACAGVPPGMCLPITIDVGTDNLALRNDPLYLGERSARITDETYDSFVDEFVSAVRVVFPDAVLQFEDFANACAFRLLDRYRDVLCCFNDDVQGTGAMAVAGLYAAGRITGRRLSDQRILFAGAGEACLGIGSAAVAAMQCEGLSLADAKGRCLFLDSRGAVVTSRTDLPEHKRGFAQDRAPIQDLRAAVDAFAPTALIGASGQGGLFTVPVLEAMARATERPIVLALSNPTSKAECTAERAYRATGGRAIFASGSPFPPVAIDGRVLVPGQANNSYVFPGVGLGLLVCGARRVTDAMLFAAARALAGATDEDDLACGRVFPPASRMRTVARSVAVAVATVAWTDGVAGVTRPPDIEAAVSRFMYEPEYRS